MHGRLSWHDTSECGVHTYTITSYYISHSATYKDSFKSYFILKVDVNES